MIKIKGFLITYKPFNNVSRVTLHHILFGRLTYRNYRNKKYLYYSPGMIDNTPFIRIVNSKIFVLNLDDINSEELRIFADINIEECERELTIDSMKTGEQYWRDISKERGLNFHVKRRK